MKINDLVGYKIAVYDSNLERFSRFFGCLTKKGYIWHIENNLDDVIYRPCVYIATNHIIFECDIWNAVKNNFLIVPTMVFEDFVEYEHRFENEQAEKIKKLLAEAFPNSERE